MTAGERYILGAFLLISDRVEHVRRLNNQGREARNQGDLSQARRCSLHCHTVATSTAARLQALVYVVAASPACGWLQARRLFKWALKLNPKCATCLKNWAESIYGGAMGDGDGSVPPKLAEVPTYYGRVCYGSVQAAALGVAGCDPMQAATSCTQAATPCICRRMQPYVLQAAIDKLERALELLPEDSDAWYSLGVLLSDQGRKDEAVAAYTRSVAINAGRRARSVLAAPRLVASVVWSASRLAAHGFGPGLLYAL